MEEKTNIVFVQLTPEKLQSMLERAAMLASMRTMVLCGVPVKDMLTRAELSEKFGRGKVDRLIKSGMLTPHQMGEGCRIKYNLSEVLTLFN